MRLLIIIASIVLTGYTQAFCETFEYFPVWNWNISGVKYKLVVNKYESIPVLSDKFSVKQITELSQPLGRINISPDGTRLCAQTYDLKKNLSKILITGPVSGEIQQILIDDKFNEFDPVFLGKNELVYSSNKTGRPKLWKIELGTSKTTQLTLKDSVDFNPDVFMPDGKIVFNAKFLGTPKTAICIVDANGGDFKYLCDGLMPKFSPDGNRIAFIEVVDNGTQLWITQTRIARPFLLATFGGRIKSLSWYGSGKIVFTSDLVTVRMKESGVNGGNFNVFMIDLNSKKLYQLTENRSAEIEAVFSSQDDSLYFISNRGGNWNIWKMDMKDVYGLAPPQEVYYLAGENSVMLSWVPADADKSEGYNVYFKPVDGKNWWRANDDVVKGFKYKVENLKDGILYNFAVTSFDQSKASESPYSMAVATRPFSYSDSLRDKELGLELDESDDGLELSWDMPQDIPGFNVYYSADPDGRFAKLNDGSVYGNKYVVGRNKKLQAGGKYYFKVAFTDSNKLSNAVYGKIPEPVVKKGKTPTVTNSIKSANNSSQASESLFKQTVPEVKSVELPAGNKTVNPASPAPAEDDWGSVSVTDW
jgi:Tol biopolymer transport system component